MLLSLRYYMLGFRPISDNQLISCIFQGCRANCQYVNPIWFLGNAYFLELENDTRGLSVDIETESYVLHCRRVSLQLHISSMVLGAWPINCIFLGIYAIDHGSRCPGFPQTSSSFCRCLMMVNLLLSKCTLALHIGL